MRRSGYSLADEPKPGALEHLAVDPMWPFFAIMFGGAWLSWPWFVINGFAVGSPTRHRELAIVIGGFVVTAMTVSMLLQGANAGTLPSWTFPYARLLITVIKLGVTYWLHVLQAQTFEIYRYYGGGVRSGIMVLMVAFVVTLQLGPRVLETSQFMFLWLE